MRIIISGCNRLLPEDAMQRVAVQQSRGVSSPPGAAARPIALPDCGRAASSFAWSERAAAYDATAGRWIARPSATSAAAGAAAELRHTSEPTLRRSPPVVTSPAGPTATGHFFHEVVEAFTVVGGLAAFGLLAGFFWVLA